MIAKFCRFALICSLLLSSFLSETGASQVLELCTFCFSF